MIPIFAQGVCSMKKTIVVALVVALVLSGITIYVYRLGISPLRTRQFSLQFDGNPVQVTVTWKPPWSIDGMRQPLVQYGEGEHRTIVTFSDGTTYAIATVHEEPVAMWKLEGEFYLVYFSVRTSGAFMVLKLNNDGQTIQIPKGMLPPGDRSFNLVPEGFIFGPANLQNQFNDWEK